MLDTGYKQAIFTKVECLTYLCHIYLRYEYKPFSATPYARRLMESYPNNPTFRAHYAEALTLSKRYAKAEPFVEELINGNTEYFAYVGMIFKGEKKEKGDKNYVEALAIYKGADSKGDNLEMRNSHFDSILYCGLGRTYLELGESAKAKDYFKLASKKAEYSWVRDEAKKFLNQL